MFDRYLNISKLHKKFMCALHLASKVLYLLALPAKKAFTYNIALHFIFLFAKW